MANIISSKKDYKQTVLSGVNDMEFSYRDLHPEETQCLLDLVKERWGFESYWYPLQGRKPQPPDVVSLWTSIGPSSPHQPGLKSSTFEDLEAHIINFLVAKGYSRIFNLSNDGLKGENWEWDVQDFCLSLYSEEIWCPPEAEWIIYTSHEGTIAFGGKWLVADIAPLLAPLGQMEWRLEKRE